MELTPEQIEILSDLRDTINKSNEKIGTAMLLFKEAVHSVFMAETMVNDILSDAKIEIDSYNDFISSILDGRSMEDKCAIIKRIKGVYGTVRDIMNRPVSYVSRSLGLKIEMETEIDGFALHFYSKSNSWAEKHKDKLAHFFDEAADLLRNGQEIECDTLAYNIDSNPEIADELTKVFRVLINTVKNNEVFLNVSSVSLSPRIQDALTKNDKTVDSILSDYVLGYFDYDTTVNNLSVVVNSSTIDAKRIIYALL